MLKKKPMVSRTRYNAVLFLRDEAREARDRFRGHVSDYETLCHEQQKRLLECGDLVKRLSAEKEALKQRVTHLEKSYSEASTVATKLVDVAHHMARGG